MKSIFGGIGGQTQGSRFEPTYETCSSDEEQVATKQAIKEEQAASQASNQIQYEEVDDAEESYYDEEDEQGADQQVEPEDVNGKNLEDVELGDTEQLEKSKLASPDLDEDQRSD